jgi:hypothetical protein
MPKLSSLKTLLILFLMAFATSRVFAQTTKPHFEIRNAGSSEEQAKYYSALKDFDFEKYRFIEKRRVIGISNSDVTIELYSAKELLLLYNREVHPDNLKTGQPVNEIRFLYFPQEGKIKPDFSKK